MLNMEKMVNKPNYVVKYHEENNTYSFKMSVQEFIDVVINEQKNVKVFGNAASASHPDKPVVVKILLSDSKPHKTEDGMVEYNDVHVMRESTSTPGLFVNYTSKHDLFVYKSYYRAYVAGKEMQIYKKASDLNYKDSLNYAYQLLNKTTEILNKVDVITKLGLNDVFNENFYNNVKSKSTDIYNECAKRYHETKSSLKDSIKHFVDELDKHDDTTPKSNDLLSNVITIYRQMVNNKFITVKRIKRDGIAHYTVTLCNCTEDNRDDKVYSVSEEEYNNVLNVLKEPGTDKAKYDSVLDILSDAMKRDLRYTEAPKKVCDKKCKCKKETKSVNKTHGRKFEIGDKVIEKSTNKKGTVIYIDTVKTSDGKSRASYLVKFSNITKSLFSYELTKVVVFV